MKQYNLQNISEEIKLELGLESSTSSLEPMESIKMRDLMLNPIK